MSEINCRWRGLPITHNSYICNSTKIVALGGVKLSDCEKCYCRDHEQVKSEIKQTIESNCIYLGEDTGERVLCKSCGDKKTNIKVFSCEKHTKCTQGLQHPEIKFCGSCVDKKTTKEIIVKEKFPIKFDEIVLSPEVKGKRFNSSIIEYKNNYVLAFRNGWAGSQIFLVKLDQNFIQVSDPWNLSLTHKDEGNYGVEDPRLFRYDNKIYISYIGVVVKKKYLYTSQLYAELTDELKVHRIFYPKYEHRNSWEKNWQFFEYNKELYAIYSVNNHRILKIEENTAELKFYNTYQNGNFSSIWEGGEIRGGASPYLHNNQFYCFFHDHVKDLDNHKIYRMGLYTFENKPPFGITRITKEPILVADKKTNPGNYASVVWPAGGVLKDNYWYISMGIHDRWTEIHRYNFDEIESKLVKL